MMEGIGAHKGSQLRCNFSLSTGTGTQVFSLPLNQCRLKTCVPFIQEFDPVDNEKLRSDCSVTKAVHEKSTKIKRKKTKGA
ncbi:MAG: hypothetical protein PSN04_03390, partial [Methyloprofundus sp.]|nr:hypothetical protein [Methyloprofundus sp.]